VAGALHMKCHTAGHVDGHGENYTGTHKTWLMFDPVSVLAWLSRKQGI